MGQLLLSPFRGAATAFFLAYTGSAHVWDASTGAELVALSRLTGSITSVSFSMDGTRIVSGSLYNRVHV